MTYPLNAPLMEYLILSVLSNNDSYGYEIGQQLKQIASMKDSTLYPILRRLQENGYMQTYDQQFQGRNRKYYKITEAGKSRHGFLQEEWKCYVAAIGQITDGGEKHD